MSLPVIKDIAPYVDVQYQTASDKHASLLEFFGEQNLSRINLICSGYMAPLQYA
jgi:hypothetical protein